MAWIIEIDPREKHPLLFPQTLILNDGLGGGRRVVPLQTRPATMLYGDYRLASDPEGVVIERKASLTEITANLFGPRRKNFILELSRLRDHTRHPYLLYEGSPASLLASTQPHANLPSPPEVLDALICTLLEYRVTPVFLPADSQTQRRSVAEFAARLLVRGETHGHRKHTNPESPAPALPGT